MQLMDAKEFAEKSGFKFRVIKRDGKNRVSTCDFIQNRINVAVEQGKITDVLCLA